jgi:phosphoglycerol transferase MdoB-like AlkP superfamily enzyme
MEIFKFFDAYSIRARLFPAIIAAAPALAALTLLISWKTFGLSNVIASLGILVLLFAIADFSRARGRAIETKLYDEYEGMPSIRPQQTPSTVSVATGFAKTPATRKSSRSCSGRTSHTDFVETCLESRR